MSIAVVGAGVSGLTTAALLAERGHDVTLYRAARAHMASAAAAAIWYLYDLDGATEWALVTLERLTGLATVSGTGVSMIELRTFSSSPAPEWTGQCGLRPLEGGFAVTVPLMDTAIYLHYLLSRFTGAVREVAPFAALADVPPQHDVIVNCTGVGARELAGDPRVHPHRGQVVVTAAQPQLDYAVVYEDALAYVIPRATSCILGGTNEESDDVLPREATSEEIRRKCAAIVDPHRFPSLEARVGLRPYREGGVRLCRERAPDGRTIVHNYGHGGAGFTVSWGCAEAVAQLVAGS